MTDYFETDSIRVLPSHPLHGDVLKAVRARKAHYEAVAEKRAARRL